jgi:hypothetical protein
MFTLLPFFIINQYIFQPNWPSAGVQVVDLKESTFLPFFVIASNINKQTHKQTRGF